MLASAALLLFIGASYVFCATELIQPDSVVIQPGQSLSIICTVSGASITDSSNHFGTAWIRQPAEKTLEWINLIYYDGDIDKKDSLKNKFVISRDTSRNTVTLQGQNLQTEDTAVYYCARDGGWDFDYWGKGTSVTVTSAIPVVTGPPQVFALSECGQCLEDFTIGCLARDLTDPNSNFKWTDSSGNVLSDFVQYPGVKSGQSYTAVSHLKITANDWDPKTSFKCQVENTKGSKEAVVTKPKTKPVMFTVSISPPRAKELYMDNKAIIECAISGFTENDVDKDMSWNFDNQTNLSFSKGQVQQRENQYTKSSVLNISSSDWFSGKEVECRSCGKKDKISYKRESEPSVLIYTSDLNKNNITLVCEVSSLTPSSVYIRWKVDNEVPTDGNHTAFVQKDGNKFVHSYLTVTNEKYEKSVFECAVNQGDKDKLKLSATSKSKPSCPPISCDK